jgi:membrane-bound lytic murein transglycosylase MltF
VAACAAVVLVGCSSPAPTEPPATAADAAPARQSIPAAAPEPAIAKHEVERLRAPGVGDIDAIRARGYLRVLVVPSRTEYAVENGVQRGATFSAGQAFEAFVNSKRAGGSNPLKVVFIPVRNDALVAELIAGHGDIAANLWLTFERDDQVAFSEPVRKGVREVIVTGQGVPPIVSLEDVAGRAIHVRKSSDHYASLVRLNQQLAKVDKPVCKIVAADEALMDEDLVRLVDAGTIPATLVDDYVYKLMKATVAKVAVNEDVAVSQDGILAWAVRKDSRTLGALVNEFLKSHDLTHEGGH